MALNPKHQSRRSVKPKPQTARKTPADASKSKLLGSGKLKQLYSSMLRCRMLAERAQLLLQEGKIGRGHQTRTGSEAAEVGAIFDLLPRDCVSCGRRDVIAALVRGAPLSEVIARLFAGTGDPFYNGSSSGATAKTTTGTVAGPLTLAARINISTGVALASKLQRRPDVVVVFSGNDATALSSWRESVDFAVAQKLPIVHVVQDDLGSEAAPPRSRTMAKDSDSSVVNGIPRLTVDGTDAVAVYRVAQEAIRRARQGHGPALIDCKTNRWVSHSEVTLPSSLSDRSRPKSFDPLSAMEAYLQERGLWSDAWKQRLVHNFSKELDSAISQAGLTVAGRH